MKIIWLGQAGLLFDFDGIKVMIDPYFSNSVERVNPNNYRRHPINDSFSKIKPNILILTHNHLDHTDPETLDIIFEKHDNICVLASSNAWNVVRKYGGVNNYVMFNNGTIWSESGITFEAVYAEHSDDKAIGVIITYKNKIYYVSGDTLYNKKVLNSIAIQPDFAFVPINGVGNNMNMIDAESFCREIGAKKVIPVHFGMFDDIDANDFYCENKIVPQIYKEIDLCETKYQVNDKYP